MNVVREVSRLEREEMQDMENEQEKDSQERARAWSRRKYHFTLIRWAGCQERFAFDDARRRCWLRSGVSNATAFLLR